MKIPNIAYEVELNPKTGYVSYFPRQDSNDDSLVHFTLPKWLVDEIKCNLDEAYELGQNKVRYGIKQLLKIGR
jgi:triphosphoribosyl-dephospho-CoA synthetase